MARSARHEAAELALLLLDVGPSEDFSQVASALGVSDEPELAVREGELLAPRLIRSDEGLVLPDGGSWRIVTAEKGRLDRLRVEVIELEALAPHQARVAVEAAGLNFRDVLNALGMVPIPWLGLELSGVVTEVGAEVTHLEVGARVFGLGEATFASSCVADARYLTPIPEGMGFDEAATIPLVYLTAWYALCDLGHLESGDAILVHAAAGGVGMAAVQLAQHLGAEVYGTASEPKWETLRALGLDDAHIASSRDLGFQQKFSTHRDGKPIDVVLNALAREFVDASLELLGSGGRFLEMGKTDIRSAQWLAENKPEIAYHAFDLLDVDPERMQAMLLEITSLLGRGEMKLLPHQSFPMARLSHVFRFMAQAKHIGKLVVVPTASERLARDEGTVLITGAFGPLGRAVAQWLVREHQVRHLLLASRRGLDTPGAQAWVAELERDGAEVTVAACDVAVLESVRALMGLVGAHTPLSGVVHTAGVLEDGVVTSQDTERLTRVLRPKVDGAWNLHLVTEGSDLDFFVLYSSLAGLMGNVGQSNYAAANTFMDALAQSRWREGQPALSMLWGPWADGGMAASLSDADTARMRRQGIELLSEERGMDLLGRAMKADSPISVAAAFDPTTYQRALSEDGRAVAPLFRELVSRGQGPRVEGQSLRERLDALPTAAREHALLDWVCDEVARVLGLSSGGAVSPTLSLKDMGVDSLMAVELRNRLMALSGEQLSATLVFDYPHVQAIAELLAERVGLAGEEADEAPGVSDDAIRDLLGRISIEELRASGMLSDLMALAEGEANGPAEVESTEEGDVEFDALDDDELLRQAMQMIED
jgi:polyketide synthase 12